MRKKKTAAQILQMRYRWQRIYRGQDPDAPRQRVRQIGLCSVEACGEPRKVKGLCRFHYARSRNGVALNAPRNAFPSDTSHTCIECDMIIVTRRLRCVSCWKRRAALLQMRRYNTVGSHYQSHRLELWHEQRGRCKVCGAMVLPIGSDSHVDHILPRAAGGSSEFANLQLTCPSCNLRKADKVPA